MKSDADADRIPLQHNRSRNTRALGKLFAAHRKRLRRMVQLLLDRRLRGRIDPSE